MAISREESVISFQIGSFKSLDDADSLLGLIKSHERKSNTAGARFGAAAIKSVLS
jgi:hypothetical protein